MQRYVFYVIGEKYLVISWLYFFIKNVVTFYVRWVVTVGEKLFFVVYPLETVFIGYKPIG